MPVPKPCPIPLTCLQLGALVQHREACRSALAFLARLFDPTIALAALAVGPPGPATAAAPALLEAQLLRVGPALIRVLLGGVAGALPVGRVEDVSPVLSALLRLAGQRCVLGWMRDALASVPDGALTLGDRDALLAAAAAEAAGAVSGGGVGSSSGGGGGANAAAAGGGGGSLDAALEATSDLCRRSRRASRAAQVALLPAALHVQLGLVA
jgi:hypothetical protein